MPGQPAPFVPRPPLSPEAASCFKAASIPVEALEDACKGCAAETGDVEDYPKGFEVDLESELLGTMQDYGRQILISTSKSDWAREVTDDASSLAGRVKEAYGIKKLGLLEKLASKLKISDDKTHEGEICKGIYPSSATLAPNDRPSSPEPRLSILNSSFNSSSHVENVASVMVLPDFKILHEVAETKEGAEELVQSFLRGSLPRAAAAPRTSTIRSWPLPYHAVVLLCSHKRRDKRCHQAAPLLISQFHHHLESHGMEVDERGDDLADGPSIEDWPLEDREAKLEESLKGVKRNGGRVGVFKVSHVGGHRYAGNVIIYLPNGSSIWYGRVTPHDVGAIVETTLVNGKVIPELLRGGLGLTQKSQPGGVLSW